VARSVPARTAARAAEGNDHDDLDVDDAADHPLLDLDFDLGPEREGDILDRHTSRVSFSDAFEGDEGFRSGRWRCAAMDRCCRG